MQNSRMFVKPTGEPFPFQPIRGAQTNRMIGSEGAWVTMNSYYNRGIRSGALEIAEPPPAKVVAAPKPPPPAAPEEPTPTKAAKRKRGKK